MKSPLSSLKMLSSNLYCMSLLQKGVPSSFFKKRILFCAGSRSAFLRELLGGATCSAIGSGSATRAATLGERGGGVGSEARICRR